MDDELKQTLDHLESKLDWLVAEIESLQKRLERAETTLLTDFRNAMQPIRIRLDELPGLNQRLGLLEQRVLDLEQRDRLT